VTSATDLDWRLTVKFESRTHAHGVFSALKTHTAAAAAAGRLKDGMLTQHDGEWVRIYGDSYEVLHRGQAIVGRVIEQEGVEADEQAERRAATPQGWESVELPPLPESEMILVSEHHGEGPWGAEVDPNRVQVHFELASHHAARAFGAELKAEGYDVHQAGSFVFIFAADPAHARELGDALAPRAPAGARLFYEGEGTTIIV
jgi:hypothetical protein